MTLDQKFHLFLMLVLPCVFVLGAHLHVLYLRIERMQRRLNNIRVWQIEQEEINKASAKWMKQREKSDHK